MLQNISPMVFSNEDLTEVAQALANVKPIRIGGAARGLPPLIHGQARGLL
jgi:hypothetical protein